MLGWRESPQVSLSSSHIGILVSKRWICLKTESFVQGSVGEFWMGGGFPVYAWMDSLCATLKLGNGTRFGIWRAANSMVAIA